MRRLLKFGGAVTCGFGAVGVAALGAATGNRALLLVSGGIATGGLVMLKQAVFPNRKHRGQ